ncbi:hypothetical protein CDIK_3211 [Cucumispora dikerogammari]|nr:hypothetical protein CDIK_3211 [Cucumispora dikerogammari]
MKQKTIKILIIGTPNFTIYPKKSYLITRYKYKYLDYELTFIQINKNILNIYDLLLKTVDLVLVCVRNILPDNDFNYNLTNTYHNNSKIMKTTQFLVSEFKNKLILWSCCDLSDQNIYFFEQIFIPFKSFYSKDNEFKVIRGCIDCIKVINGYGNFWWFKKVFYCFYMC